MRNRLAQIIDLVVFFLFIGILTFAWIRYYTRDLTLSLIAAICVSTISTCIINVFIYKKEEKSHLTKEQQNKFFALKYNLMIQSETEILKTFCNILNQPASTNNFVINNNYIINSQALNTIVYPYFSHEKLTSDLVFNILKKISNHENLTIKIIGCQIDDDAKALLKKMQNVQIVFVSLQNFCKENPSIFDIDIKINFDKPKTTLSILAQYATNPKRAKNYLLYGFLLIFTSFLVPFKLYYLIFGSVLCLVALVIKILPNVISKRLVDKK